MAPCSIQANPGVNSFSKRVCFWNLTQSSFLFLFRGKLCRFLLGLNPAFWGAWRKKKSLISIGLNSFFPRKLILPVEGLSKIKCVNIARFLCFLYRRATAMFSKGEDTFPQDTHDLVIVFLLALLNTQFLGWHFLWHKIMTCVSVPAPTFSSFCLISFYTF